MNNEPNLNLQPLKKKKPRNTRKRGTVLALALFLLFCVVLSGTLTYAYIDANVNKPLAQLIRPVSRGTGEPQIQDTPAYNVIMGRSWNILLLGSDNDGKYNFPAVLTQVMMVIHIDPDNGNVSMVSIPRDSWVPIAGVGGMHKIDQAFFLGVTKNGNTFENGVQTARTTIEQDYGITIDRYAWVGLSGFAKVIDTLGGVDIDLTHPVVDDAYPNDTGTGSNASDPFAYKRLYLPPGPQHLNGEQALEYVRSRHSDLIGDIGRTQRQQQVLEALKKKLTVSSVLANLSQIIKDVTGQVYTDLSESEMIAFANFGRTLQSSAIQRITLGPGQGSQDYGDYSTVYDPVIGSNQDVILPNCTNIQPVLVRMFNLTGLATCNVSGP